MKNSQFPYRAEPYSIALLEDDEDFGPLLKEMLEAKDYVVSLHANAISALAFIDNNPVDLVITDLFIEEDGQISGQGGLTLISKIRHIMQHPAPIIAISGSFTQETTNAAASATTLGANYTLAKPIDPPKLFDVIERCLNQNASG